MPASVDLGQAALAVVPGQAVSTTIRLANTGRIVDELALEVLGDAAAYATIEPAQLPLFPGAHGEATITFRPPRGSTPAAGTVPFGIRVRSREDRAFSFVAEGRLTIAAVMDMAAHLTPRTSVGSRTGQGARHRIDITNNSNTTARVRLAAADADERLTFAIAQPVLTIPAGGSAGTTVSVKGRSRMMTGAQTMRPFQVSVATDGAAPITLDGTFTQRATLVGGTSQILTLAVLVGVGGLLATQALPLLNPAAATLPPATAAPASVAASIATVAPATPAPITAPPTAAPPTPPPAPTPAPATAAPPTAAPTAAVTPSAAPLSIRILNLGLVDPLGTVPEQTPTPDTTPEPTLQPGQTLQPPIRVFPSFPTRLLNSGSRVASGSALAFGGPAANVAAPLGAARNQDPQPGLPVQQFGIQVTGPVDAQITRVNDNTAPTLCLLPDGGSQQCSTSAQALVGKPPGTDATTWFMSVVAQQGGTSVDVKVDYAPQPVTFGFKDLHLAGVSATSTVHLVIQASSAGLIEIVTEVNVGADVTVAVRDLNTQVAAPPSTTPAGGSGAPFVAAAEPGHLYDILLTSTSADEVFVSGTISWP